MGNYYLHRKYTSIFPVNNDVTKIADYHILGNYYFHIKDDFKKRYRKLLLHGKLLFTYQSYERYRSSQQSSLHYYLYRKSILT